MNSCRFVCLGLPDRSVHSNTKEQIHEAHLSAKPPCPRPSSRLSRPHGHGWWSQHPACASCTRPQETVGLNRGFDVQAAQGQPVAGDLSPATSQSAVLASALRIGVIRKRADFVAANHAVRVARPGFVLLVRSGVQSTDQARFGVTVTKKIGNAVCRNRMKRRFRALLRDILPSQGIAGADHVLIGREGGVERDFALLRIELAAALARVAAGKGDPPRRPRTGAKR